ncbi:MAG: dihydroorotase [Candidatus Eisenbacteria bacterium]|uniref:Dihydroorotase n=1 Tax=Eiseniibacteriota bacterium TaxID=2212470 RepID=A0A937X9U8_UNCEI|nr:dihydroorotase [Candidatus Eisenbacteria bacterium]
MAITPEAKVLWEKAETILLRGGRIVDPEAGLDGPGDAFLRRGRVELVAPAIHREADLAVELRGLVLAPGFGDLHVHLREPGREDAETIATGSRAAALGGFTRVACMPNTDPPLDTRAAVEFVLRQARACGLARVFPVAAATRGRAGAELTDMGELREAGVLAVSDDGSPVADARVMRRVLEYARTWGLLVVTHAEEPALSRGGVMHEGYWSTLLGLRGIPAAAEGIAVARDVRLAELTGARLHVAHVSTAEAVETIRAAKRRGVAVTAETAPHYIALTDEALKTYDSVYRVNPPLRSEDDRAAVIAGLRDGTLDAVATDHAPHTEIDKEQELEATPAGMIGMETALGVTLEVLHHREGFDLPRVVRLLSAGPAAVMGWGGGRIRLGEDADLTVFDGDASWTVDPGAFASRARNCPFRGWSLRGRARLTVCSGKLTHEEGVEFCPSERLLSRLP